MVVKMDEWVTVGGVIYPLFANRWKSADFPIVPPVGCASLVRFYQDGQIPTWQFQPGESEFETKVWMEHGEEYNLRSILKYWARIWKFKAHPEGYAGVYEFSSYECEE